MSRLDTLAFLPSFAEKEFEWEKKIKTVSVLGALAVAGHFVEEFDWHTGQFIIDHILNTIQHPYAGYWGAMMGNFLVRKGSLALKLSAIGLGTVAGDISAETYQSWDLTGDPTKTYIGHGQTEETLRDATAAGIAGLALYPYQIRQQLFKRRHN